MSDKKISAATGKPPLGIVPAEALVGPARVFQYGSRRYAPGNFLEADLSDGAGERYVSAALRHLMSMQEPNGLHTPESLGAIDAESGLPHLDHAICGLLMLRSIMAKADAIDIDPGEGRSQPDRAALVEGFLDVEYPDDLEPPDPELSAEDVRDMEETTRVWTVPLSWAADEEDPGPYRPHRGHVGYGP